MPFAPVFGSGLSGLGNLQFKKNAPDICCHAGTNKESSVLLAAFPDRLLAAHCSRCGYGEP